MKAIAEADKVKKEYIELVNKENKDSAKNDTKNSTSTANVTRKSLV